MRTALIVAFSLTWTTVAALAQTTSPSPPIKSPDTAAPAASSGAESDAADALASCLEMWDAATHMTRRQWAHACRRVADRIRNMTVK